MQTPGGRTAFFTIALASGLSRSDHRRAARLGPRAGASTRPIAELTEAAGYVDVVVESVTQDFLDTALAWLAETKRFETRLRSEMGDQEIDRQLSDRRDIIRALEDSLLERVLVSATVPS